MPFQKDNVVESKAAIIADIDSLGYQAYGEDAPTEAVYPYVVLDMMNSDADGANTEIFILYINGWSEGSNSLPLDEMMFNINNRIDQKVYTVPGSSLSMRVVLDNKLAVNDPDVELKHRVYRYQIRTIQGR